MIMPPLKLEIEEKPSNTTQVSILNQFCVKRETDPAENEEVTQGITGVSKHCIPKKLL